MINYILFPVNKFGRALFSSNFYLKGLILKFMCHLNDYTKQYNNTQRENFRKR